MIISIPDLFTAFFIFSGIGMYPRPQSETWSIKNEWQLQENGYQMSLSSTEIIKECQARPNDSIVFPQIIHSFHEFFLDGFHIASYGNPTFSKAVPFYEKPSINCSQIVKGKKLTWTVTTYSKFFARLREWPQITPTPNSKNIFNVALNVGAFSILIILSIFSALIYRGRVSDELTYSLSVGSLVLSGYFLNAANSYLGINYSMLTAHKIADSCLWLGAFFFINAFFAEGFLNKSTNWVFRVFCLAGIYTIIRGNNGDEVQFGTMLPMGIFIFCAVQIVVKLILKIMREGLTAGQSLKVVSIFTFTFFGLNDALNVMGIINSEMLLSLGSVGGFFGLSISVSQAIKRTYDERDTLLNKLEEKVREKTSHLEVALHTLKSTQAELIQSARLASLGTLSAGIAHEINNSINYVNGALVPLERKIQTLVPKEERGTIDKLMASIKEGTHLTVEIVKSLRHFTGLNQAQVKDINLKEVVNSVLNILKSRIKDTHLDIKIEENIKLTGSVVGLNQIFMNLLSNSLDALDKQQKVVKISAKQESNGVYIEFEDNGSGIPNEILGRIFDPFFTTKQVGQGSGLGLHIVSKEIEKHNGTIKVSSTVGIGTKFEIFLPNKTLEKLDRKAA